MKTSKSKEWIPVCKVESLNHAVRWPTHLIASSDLNCPPWQRRGGRAIKKYPRSFERRGRGGSFKLQNNFCCTNHAVCAHKVASRHFLKGRSHPSFAKEGNLLHAIKCVYFTWLSACVVNFRY